MYCKEQLYFTSSYTDPILVCIVSNKDTIHIHKDGAVVLGNNRQTCRLLILSLYTLGSPFGFSKTIRTDIKFTVISSY